MEGFPSGLEAQPSHPLGGYGSGISPVYSIYRVGMEWRSNLLSTRTKWFQATKGRRDRKKLRQLCCSLRAHKRKNFCDEKAKVM